MSDPMRDEFPSERDVEVETTEKPDPRDEHDSPIDEYEVER